MLFLLPPILVDFKTEIKWQSIHCNWDYSAVNVLLWD